jgi:hypothetical protein
MQATVPVSFLQDQHSYAYPYALLMCQLTADAWPQFLHQKLLPYVAVPAALPATVPPQH